MSARTTTFLTAVVMVAVACSTERAVAPDLAASFRSFEAPSGTFIVVVDHNRLAVHWQDNSPNETGYEVHRATGLVGAFALVASVPTGSTAYVNTGLTAQTEYCYRVRAFRKTGKNTTYSAYSNTACATTPLAPVPGAPSGVSAAPDRSNRNLITWTDNSSDENGFRVRRASSAEGPWTSIVTVTSNVVSSYDQQPPAVEQPVCYQVIAFNGFGDSPASNVACTSRPAAPTALVAAVSGSDVDLSWTDNSSVEDGYQVERWTAESGASEITVIAVLPADATSYRDVGIADGTYAYQVQPRRDGGITGGANASATILTMPPVAPEAVNAYPSSSGVTTVAWTDNSTNEAAFRIERSTDGGASWVVAGAMTVHPYWPNGEFTDVGQPSEQMLCYRVTAFNELGDSPPSSIDCTALPLAATDFSATTVNATTIDFAWTDNSAVEDGYAIARVWDSCDEEGCGTAYQSFVIVGPNTTSHRASGLRADDYYYSYVVIAIRDGGRSDVSNRAAAVTISNLTATPVSAGRVDLDWTNNIPNDGVFIERCEHSGHDCTIGGFGGRGWAFNPSTFSDTTVQSGRTYSYRAKSYNAMWGWFSLPSNVATAIAP